MASYHMIPVRMCRQERFSIAYFFQPAFDAVVECLPQCCGPDRCGMGFELWTGQVVE